MIEVSQSQWGHRRCRIVSPLSVAGRNPNGVLHLRIYSVNRMNGNILLLI